MLPAKSLLGRPRVKDTVGNVYSTTKAMTALPACLIADCGELDFDAPVAKYRPEFAANGRQPIKVSHLISRQSVSPAGGIRARFKSSRPSGWRWAMAAAPRRPERFKCPKPSPAADVTPGSRLAAAFAGAGRRAGP